MRKYIGDKSFYKMVCAMALPLIIQNFITNFVSFLDNIMVGKMGTEQMSGVAIIGNMVFIFYLAVFGGFSGAGIFSAQFHGRGDHKSVGDTMRYKLYLGIVIFAVALVIFIFFDDELIMLFLKEGGENVGDIDLVLQYAKEYLSVMLIGLLPYTLTQMYSSTLRETGSTLLPMVAGALAVIVNIFFNYVLIFGKLGAPSLGARGAAIATVISRFTELLVVALAVHLNSKKYKFIKGFYKKATIPMWLTKEITVKGLPLLFNEMMWSMGQTALIQNYCTRGLLVVAGFNICSTLTNLFNIAFISIGSAISIVVGPLLGCEKIEEAKDTDRKMIFLSVSSCMVMGVIFLIVAPYIPRIYNTEDSVKLLASQLMRVSAVVMPVHAFNNACYFTIRAGGKTYITTLFDSVYVWVIAIPIAFVLSRYTQINIVLIYFLVNGSELIKSLIGFIIVKNGAWARNLTVKEQTC